MYIFRVKLISKISAWRVATNSSYDSSPCPQWKMQTCSALLEGGVAACLTLFGGEKINTPLIWAFKIKQMLLLSLLGVLLTDPCSFAYLGFAAVRGSGASNISHGGGPAATASAGDSVNLSLMLCIK